MWSVDRTGKEMFLPLLSSWESAVECSPVCVVEGIMSGMKNEMYTGPCVLTGFDFLLLCLAATQQKLDRLLVDEAGNSGPFMLLY